MRRERKIMMSETIWFLREKIRRKKKKIWKIECEKVAQCDDFLKLKRWTRTRKKICICLKPNAHKCEIRKPKNIQHSRPKPIFQLRFKEITHFPNCNHIFEPGNLIVRFAIRARSILLNRLQFQTTNRNPHFSEFRRREISWRILE